ncbi:MAG: RNHCP domain-containing protein [Spirochaetes bacterium]|nr:RNHCP domain-containing protein [Spirochaetota bacterium]
MKKFTKNDQGFVCQNCGQTIPPLKTTSRDHCTVCLCSLHVDIHPGDRQNTCCGLLKPIGIEISTKKGYLIIYRCEKCGEKRKNRSAPDDSMEKIIEISVQQK